MSTQAVTGSSAPATRDAPPPAAPPAAAPAPDPSQAKWGLALLVLIVGMFMSILDTSIVNVAIPTIQKDFGATTDQVQWVSTAYTLALGVVVPLSAWLGQKFGMSRVYNASLLAFAAGSALCGVAFSLNSLVVFRIVQAIPGGILPVVTLSMLYRIVPREKIGAAMGMYGLGIIFAPAIGPTLGGYLVEYVDWRLIFFINVPIGILGAVAAMMVLPKFGPGRAGKFDVLGFVAIAVALFSLLLALSEGQSWGWSSYKFLILIAVGLLSLALFVVIELEVDEPLLDVRVFRFWPFTNSLLLISVLSVGLFAVLFYVPLFLQQAQGLGAFDAGLTLLPQAVVMGILMPVAGRLYDKIGPRWPATIGLLIVALGTYLMHDLTLDTSRTTIIELLCFRAAGMGLAMMPIMTGGISAVPPGEVGAASAYNNVVQRTAAALGLAVLTALLTTQQAQMLGDRSALIASSTPLPDLAPGPAGQVAGMYAVYTQTQTQVFVAALDQLFIITSIITLLGVVLALMLRSGPAPAAPAAPKAEPAAPAEAATVEPKPVGPQGNGHAGHNGNGDGDGDGDANGHHAETVPAPERTGVHVTGSQT
jgi:EmrB/QacA subfamily drug resistance transporter